jgi:transposase
MAPTDRNAPKRAASSDSTYSLMEFMRDFPNDAACLEWLWRTRFAADGEHAECPKCEQVRSFKRYATAQGRQSWTCTGCGHHLHPTAGTIFHKSSTSLHLWFYAMYLMTSTRCGISAKQLERELGVTYKTAWRMFHLIRTDLMEQDREPLDGDVEMDETFIGGRSVRASDRITIKSQPTQGHKMREAQRIAAKRKTTVFGMVERGGRVRAEVVPSRRTSTLMRGMEQRVLPSAVVFTDELKSYDALDRKGYQHHRIHHAAQVYVDGDTHTNTIEGFWSLVKNGLRGTYHAVSAKHLQGYLNEFAWRYNHRHDPQAQFLTLALRSAQECRSL